MDLPKLLSAAFVVLVVVWAIGSGIELFATTLSIGPDVAAVAVSVGFVALVVVLAVALGARSRRWLHNPDSYW